MSKPNILNTTSFLAPNTQSLWQDMLPGGCHWSTRIRRGTILRFTTQAAHANLSALFFNAEEKLDRYNACDTLKAQHTAFLTRGHVCYSDFGHILCGIVADSTGWSDAFCGISDDKHIRTQFGHNPFGKSRNDMYRSGREGMLTELAKWGLGTSDLVSNINFFSKVTANDTGELSWQANHNKAGDFIELRFEMDTIVVLSSAPHPLDPVTSYHPAAIEISAFAAPAMRADDPCLISCDQNTRGYQNNERYFATNPSQLLINQLLANR